MKVTLKVTKPLKVPRSILKAEDLKAVGAVAVASVRQRVGLRGHGVQDNAMPPYTPAYARRKYLYGGQVQFRDLFLTGRFLGSLRHWGATAAHVYVGFTAARSQLLAAVHGARSPFLGLSPSDAEKVRAEFAARIAARVKDLKFT